MTGSAGRFLGFGTHTSGASVFDNCSYQGIYASTKDRCSIGFDQVFGSIQILNSLYSVQYLLTSNQSSVIACNSNDTIYEFTNVSVLAASSTISNVDNSSSYSFGVITALKNGTCTFNTLIISLTITLVNKFQNSGFAGNFEQVQLTLVQVQITSTLDLGNS
jgi:hypothetical protein